MAEGWVRDIESSTLANDTFRTVLYTGEHMQVTVMAIPPGGEIGREVHPDNDQFLRLEQGDARVEFGTSEDSVDETHEVKADWAVIVPAGVWHNVVNIGWDELKLY
jgi:mannose-6-phosphate isomerase-like protein (cupin superfamily)